MCSFVFWEFTPPARLFLMTALLGLLRWRLILTSPWPLLVQAKHQTWTHMVTFACTYWFELHSFSKLFLCCFLRRRKPHLVAYLYSKASDSSAEFLLPSRLQGLNFTCQSEKVVFTSVSVTRWQAGFMVYLSTWLWVVSPKLSITAGGLSVQLCVRKKCAEQA